MSASTDQELERLLDAWATDALEVGSVFGVMGLRNHGGNALEACRQTVSHTAILRHIAANYVSRKEIASHDDRHNY